MVGVKEFSGLQVFEFAYLMLLAFLPFVILIQEVAYIILSFLLVIAAFAVYKKVRHRSIKPQGKTVLITGCDSGFGNACARRLVKQGFEVIAGCLDDKSERVMELKEICPGLMHVIKLDVTKAEDIEKCVSFTKETTGHKGLWALVNNAGVFTFGDLELCPMEDFHKVMEVNVFGALQITRALLPLIRNAKGRVVTMSGASGLMAFPGQSAFCMSQHSLVAMMDSLRLEMRPFKVEVISILPGNFFGTTRHLSQKSIEKWQSTFEERKNSVDDELLGAYGDDYWETQHAKLSELSMASANSMVKVIDVMEAAIKDLRPQKMYLVDGGRQLLDAANIMVRLRSLLPTWMRDFILVKLYSNSHKRGYTPGYFS